MTDKLTYTCKGPRQTVGDKRAALEARLDELNDQMRAHPAETRGPLERKIIELEEEMLSFMGLPDDQDLGRVGCGYDLTAQIDAIPDDGDVYEYVCPKCGNSGTARKAVPELEEG